MSGAMRYLFILLSLITQGAPSGPGNGNSPAAPIDYNTAKLSRVVTAHRLDGEITLDGKLNEPVWKLAEPAANFIQREPNTGAPATEQTEVRFLYDSKNLYIGAWCFQRDMSEIVVNELKEDFGGQDNDEFVIFLDTLHDRRSGVGWAINPAGARRDWQAYNDGDQINTDWDGLVEVRVSRDGSGWYVEMQIPFTTLRFATEGSQEWGLNLGRRLRKHNEDSAWSPLPRRYRSISRGSLAGTLRGFEGIHQGRNLKMKPYVKAGVLQTRPANRLESKFERDSGVDLKYGVTQSLTLDATFRTDFSQVEVDQQQVNLTRFNLFFPEKREFFLENAGNFSFGATRGTGSSGLSAGNANLVPFFSRRVGLNTVGTAPIPILGGTRLSGKAGGYDLGFLAMKTESAGSAPSNTFGVARVKRNFWRQSHAGVLFTNRDSTRPGDYNRVYGADLSLRFFQKFDVVSYVLRSDSPNKRGRNLARDLEIGWFDDDFTISGQYEDVLPNFNPEMGFVRRPNMQHYTTTLSWRPRLQGHRYIRNFEFSTSPDYYAAGNGSGVETRTQDLNLGVVFHNSASVTLNAFNNFDRLKKPFEIRTKNFIPAGDYNYRRYATSFSLDRSRKISGGANVNWGEFWNGTETSFGGTLDMKPNYHLNGSLTFSQDRVKLPSGPFTSRLLGARTLYAVSSRMFFNAFIQYNAETHQFSSNIRFQLIHHSLSDLFIVYNDRRDTLKGQVIDRALVVKLTNLFSF